jgi:hypothetical protein
MDYLQREPMSPIRRPQMVAGEWYLKGFADAYHAHQVVSPSGPAGEEYGRGYTAGLEAVQRDFFAAVWAGFQRRTSLVDAQGARWPLSVVGAPMTA